MPSRPRGQLRRELADDEQPAPGGAWRQACGDSKTRGHLYQRQRGRTLAGHLGCCRTARVVAAQQSADLLHRRKGGPARPRDRAGTTTISHSHAAASMIHDMPSKHGSGRGEGKPTRGEPRHEAVQPGHVPRRIGLQRQTGRAARRSTPRVPCHPTSQARPSSAGSSQAGPPDRPREEIGPSDGQRPRPDGFTRELTGHTIALTG